MKYSKTYLTVEIDNDLRERMRYVRERNCFNWSAWIRRSIDDHIKHMHFQGPLGGASSESGSINGRDSL